MNTLLIKNYEEKGFKKYETKNEKFVQFAVKNHNFAKDKNTQIKEAVIGAGSLSIIEKTIKKMIGLPIEILKAFGLDERMVNLFAPKIIKNKTNLLLSRFDMIGDKTIEINSLTPFMLEESLVHDGDEKSYDIFVKNYVNYIEKKAKELKFDIKKCNFVASSWDKEIAYEDFRVTEFIKESVEKELGIKIPQVKHEDLTFDFEGNKLMNGQDEVHIWINPTLPVEFLLEDETGVGIQIVAKVAADELVVVNPFEAYFAQNKAIYALIWENRKNDELYEKEEQEFIEKHFPKTSFSPDQFIEEGEKYVKKSVFGREGSNVSIVNPKTNETIESNSKGGYEEFGFIYQEMLESPKVKITNSLNEEKECFLVKGPFFINNNFISTAHRAGEIITSNESYYLI